MRGLVLSCVGGVPELVRTPAPVAPDGLTVVPVLAAGLNPVDLKMAADEHRPVPRVVGNEGVVVLHGRRGYAERTVAPHGSMAEQAVVDPATVIPLPDDVDDASALGVGIAGLAAWMSLATVARVQSGETVAVLGATGGVGRIAVQVARLLGAGRVVAVGRNRERLNELSRIGADGTVVLGSEDVAAQLRDAAEGGFDVVLDLLYGEPLLAALRATRQGARVVLVGSSGGDDVRLPFAAVRGRSLLTYSNQLTPPEPKRAAYHRLLEHVRVGDIHVLVETRPFDMATEVWQRQSRSPGSKLVLRI